MSKRSDIFNRLAIIIRELICKERLSIKEIMDLSKVTYKVAWQDSIALSELGISKSSHGYVESLIYSRQKFEITIEQLMKCKILICPDK